MTSRLTTNDTTHPTIMWRTKYKERFMSGGDDEKKDVNPTPADEKKEEDEDEKETFNDLFSEERK